MDSEALGTVASDVGRDYAHACVKCRAEEGLIIVSVDILFLETFSKRCFLIALPL